MRLGSILRMTSIILWHISEGLWELGDFLDKKEIVLTPDDIYEELYEAEYEDKHYESLDKKPE